MLLNGRKIEEYVIVVQRYNLSYYVLREVNELNEFLCKKIGKKLDVIKDHEETTALQIIIGNCKRDGVEAISEHTEYRIKSENGNVYINGGRNYSTARAVEIFTELLQKSDDVKIKNVSGNTADGKGSDGYRLVWNDEFETLDKDSWYIMNGDSGHYGWYGKCPFRSGSPENVFVKDGNLHLRASYDDENFYGSYLTSSPAMEFNKGYMEISARIADGDGIWDGFWTWNNTAEHLEFDIMESWSGGKYFVSYVHEFEGGKHIPMFGEDKHDPNHVVFAHFSDFGDKIWGINGHESVMDWDAYWKPDFPNMHNEYHTFGCEWDDESVKFYRDGELTLNWVYKGTPKEYLYSTPTFFILSMLVGSNYAKQPDSDPESKSGVKKPKLDKDYWNDDRCEFVIDYIQLFQKDGQYLKIKNKKED